MSAPLFRRAPNWLTHAAEVWHPAILRLLLALCTTPVAAQHPEPMRVPAANASSAAEMKPYAEVIEHTRAKIEMVPIAGGEFEMGSSDGDDD